MFIDHLLIRRKRGVTCENSHATPLGLGIFAMTFVYKHFILTGFEMMSAACECPAGCIFT